MDRVEAHFRNGETPAADAITGARSGVLAPGASGEWRSFCSRAVPTLTGSANGGMTPLDVARREEEYDASERFDFDRTVIREAQNL
jgi:hypothetical protein